MKQVRYMLFAALLVACLPAVAQDNADAQRRADCHTSWMVKELNLNASQQNSVKLINRETVKQMEEAKFKEPDQAAVEKRAKELDLERDDKLEDVLRPNQMLMYAKRKDRVPQFVSTCILNEK